MFRAARSEFFRALSAKWFPSRNHLQRPNARRKSRPTLQRFEDRIAPAGFLDLTTVSSGIVNGAVFRTVSTGGGGTGVLHSFVRMEGSPTEQGYNTNFRPLQFDEKADATFTRSLMLVNVPIVTNVPGAPSSSTPT